jgi:hypothetical protein
VGTSIGFCLRIAQCSPISRTTVDTVKTVVRSFAQEMNAGLARLIISEFKSQHRRYDAAACRRLGQCDTAARALRASARGGVRVSTCRILDTGAYHLAVFALSQGIPVVALSSSGYYDDNSSASTTYSAVTDWS